jgi:hypothetical protein
MGAASVLPPTRRREPPPDIAGISFATHLARSIPFDHNIA